MTLATGLVMVAALSLSLSAQPRPMKHAAPEYVGTASKEVSAAALSFIAKREPRQVAPNVASESGDWIYIFPIVGSTPGAGGTYFRSETTLVNNLDRHQDALLFYFPATGGNCNTVSGEHFRFAPFTWYGWPDFVANVFGRLGLGSVIVVAVDQFGNPDASADLDGFSRIWTPSPAGGTGSQGFPPVALTTYPETQWAYGLRQDQGFRTNVGVFNYLPDGGNTPRTFDVYVNGINGDVEYSIVVAACSMALQSIPAGNFGPLIVAIRPRDQVGGWYGFASSVDNVSGDNWSSTARP